MKEKLKSLSVHTYNFLEKNISALYKFTKRNKKELKVIATPFSAIAFMFFAFSGFLMNDIMNSYFVVLSKIITVAMISCLLLYCIWDLLKSILLIPLKLIFNRERAK